MPGIMADNDILGQFSDLLKLLQSPAWRDVWEELQIPVKTFKNLGLEPNAVDAVVWQACQAHETVLFTGNRNNKDSDSLENTIRTQNQANSLPVITLGDVKRFSYDRAYADEVAEALLDILMDLDNRRGAGRLYVP
jgi:hypothetical protein